MAFGHLRWGMAGIVLGGLLGGDMGLYGGLEVSWGFLCRRGSRK